MKILVCVRQGTDGEINPFDACAYEQALRIDGAKVSLVSMGPMSAKELLLKLTRLGGEKAILLSDKAFAGADTLATAYTLSLAVKKLKPDLVFCGRQTLVGDTAQTGPMLSVYAGYSLITNVMSIDSITDKITCTTRDNGVVSANIPALITIERINTLRRPSILSKPGEVEIWSAADIDADISKCGLKGSPTRVLKTFENLSGKRKCEFIKPEELKKVIELSLKKAAEKIPVSQPKDIQLPRVFSVGNDAGEFAKTISCDITVLDKTDPHTIAGIIKNEKPNAVLWSNDAWGKQAAAQTAAICNIGICADCTALETDGEQLIMYRPALSSSIIAKIVSLTKPAMATVCTAKQGGDIVVCAGFGIKDSLDAVKRFAESLNASMATTRKAVDNNVLPYRLQVGLTGKTMSPPIYIAIGVSGAVHHIVGMQQAGTVIAINPDRSAPIFEYADFGIISNAECVLRAV